jgi:phenylalanyl-tRNA synthetase beta chain
MLTPLSWLKDFARFPDDVDLITSTLDRLGLVVEDVTRVGVGLDRVLVAEVLEISAIEGADRIRKVVVDAGSGPTQVVCGAWNFSIGDLVALAQVGTELPNGMEIGRRKMRGVVSDGMLCSGKELGISENSDGLLILTGTQGATLGMSVAAASSIEPDVVFDITVEGNRPDAWSISGVARDLAAALGLDFAIAEPDLSALPEGDPIEETVTLRVEDSRLCPRFTARLISGVKVQESPSWIARRLTLAGMRPINNVVDASNYVMLELGQPNHPYDLDRLGRRGLLVRKAKNGETLVTLDGVKRTLGVPGKGLPDSGEDCLICDAEGTPVGIGGIMGGSSSEISSTTTSVLLETAYFSPIAIAKTSKRLGLRTEASSRFERGCDPWGIDRAAARFVELVSKTSPLTTLSLARGQLDERGETPTPFQVTLPVAKVNSLLGVDLDASKIAATLEPIGFRCDRRDDAPSEVHVSVPTNRPDVRSGRYGVIDLIEEVARMIGYERLPKRKPSWPQPGGLSVYQKKRRFVREICCGLGAFEVWTSSFLDDDDQRRLGLPGTSVRVANPLVHSESALRRSLMPGMLKALSHNFDRRQDSLRLFEIGTVFLHPSDVGNVGGNAGLVPVERELLAIAFAGTGDDVATALSALHVIKDALGLEGVISRSPGQIGYPATLGFLGQQLSAGTHPSRSGSLIGADETVIGAIGEVDPELISALAPAIPERRAIGWLQIDLGLTLDPAIVNRRVVDPDPPSRFPSAEIDLAFVVPDEIPADLIATTLKRTGNDLLEDVRLFDVYRGSGVSDRCRSLAFRLSMCSRDHTLSDSEISDVRQRCIDAVLSQHEGTSLR